MTGVRSSSSLSDESLLSSSSFPIPALGVTLAWLGVVFAGWARAETFPGVGFAEVPLASVFKGVLETGVVAFTTDAFCE